MRNLKNLILCVVILIMVPFLGFASPSGSALASVNTMDFEWDWFDLETGTVIPSDPWDPGFPPTNACDFKFAYNALREPHAVIFQNQNPFPGVEIAYSEEDYTDVTFSDVAIFVFTPHLVDIPFDKVAVLHTTEGNYFKVGPISENGPFTVTFEWEQLVQTSPTGMLDGLRAYILQQVALGNIDTELEGSLLAKVNAALAALDRGNPNDAKVAMNVLKALINQVEALVDKKITADAAAAIIQSANDIIAELGG